jgi:hypothetical protein
MLCLCHWESCADGPFKGQGMHQKTLGTDVRKQSPITVLTRQIRCLTFYSASSEGEMTVN